MRLAAALAAAAAASHLTTRGGGALAASNDAGAGAKRWAAVGGVACCAGVTPGKNDFPPWERDYLLELASSGPDGPCVCKGDPANPVEVTVVSVLTVDYPKHVPLEYLRGVLSGFRSKVVVMLGDETCIVDQARMDDITRGFGYTLILRQYACGQQGAMGLDAPGRPIVLPMPLGWGRGMMPFDANGGDSAGAGWSVAVAKRMLTEASAPRPLRWSFLGTMRRAREAAVRAFKTLEPHLYGQASKRAVAFAYGNADFVLSPRGNKNLDCFRAYEASAFGAIPVVMGGDSEVNATFSGLAGSARGELPPWLFAPNWEQARDAIRSMSAREIKARRQSVLEWWVRTVSAMQAMIADAARQDHDP